MARYLHLHLKREYFGAIKAGEKKEEFRSFTNFWARQLKHAPFDGIVIYDAYPPAGDRGRIITRPWRGFSEKVITHHHFGPKPTRVFAITVN